MITYNWFRPENRFMAGLPLRKRSGRLFLFFFYIYRKKKPGIHPGRTGEVRRKQAGPAPYITGGACAAGNTRGVPNKGLQAV